MCVQQRENKMLSNNHPCISTGFVESSQQPLPSIINPTTQSNPKDKVVFIYVCDKEAEDQTELKYHQLSCYAHFHVMSTFLIMGSKQNDAAEMADQVFKWISEAKHNLTLQHQKQQLSENTQHTRGKHSSEEDEDILLEYHHQRGRSDSSEDASLLAQNNIHTQSSANTAIQISINNPPTVDEDSKLQIDSSSSSEGESDGGESDEREDEEGSKNSPTPNDLTPTIIPPTSLSVKHVGSFTPQFYDSDDNSNTLSKSQIKKKKHRKHKSARSPYDSGNDIDESDHDTPAKDANFIPINDANTTVATVDVDEFVLSSSPLVSGKMFSDRGDGAPHHEKRILKYDKHLKSKSYLVREITYMLKQNRSLKIPHTISKKNERSNVVFLTRNQFQEIIRIALTVFGYNRANRVRDFQIACSIQERKRPLIILFGGTSGTGKSTLASLIASRLGITKVLSTDNIRHMLRAFISKEEEPVLFASTYHAGEALLETQAGKELKDTMTPEELTVEGFRRQCKLVIEQLEKIIDQAIERNEGLVVEGVHLLTDFIVELMKKHPTSILPYIIYISNQQKHKERFAIRAKYMTLEPRNNKYVKYFQNIRQIQKYLYDRADAFNVPKIDNTNIDRSIAAIHGSVFKSMKMVFDGKKLFNYDSEKCLSVHPKTLFIKQHQWSSKRMLQALQRKRESLEIKTLTGSQTTKTTTIQPIDPEQPKSISHPTSPTEAQPTQFTRTLLQPSTSTLDELPPEKPKATPTTVAILKSSSDEENNEDVDDKTVIINRSRRSKKNSIISKKSQQVTFDTTSTNEDLTTLTVQTKDLTFSEKNDQVEPSSAETKDFKTIKKKKKKLLEETILPRPDSPEELPQTPQNDQNGTDTESSKRYNYYTTSEGVCSLSERDQDSEYGQWIEMDTS